MNTLVALLLITGPVLSQTSGTVPGTYPPVPKKYWVPVRQPTPATSQPTGRRISISDKGVITRESGKSEGPDYEPLTESGVVRWAGSQSLHVVKKGETMWDLAKKYFGNHWFWPQLWSWNPHITNPHWLFPGTKVWLTSSKRVQKAISSKPGFDGISFNTDTVKVRKKAFIQEKEFAKSAKVVGSVEEKTLLSSGDYIYIKQPEGKKKQLIVGQRYTVYRPLGKTLYEPARKQPKGAKKAKKPPRKKIGRVVKVLGEVIIRELRPKNMLRAQIVSSIYTIKRNDMVGTRLTTFNRITPQPAPLSKRTVGKIVDSIEAREMLSPGHIVLINLGQEKGMKKGSSLKVLVRGDGLYANLHPLDPDKKNDKTFPYESKGVLVVLHAARHYSLAMVLKSVKPVKVGDFIVYGDFPDRKKEEGDKEKGKPTVEEGDDYEEVG